MVAPDLPEITVRPGYAFGRPAIRGVSTVAIAGMVWAGEAVETVTYEYTLSPVEVLWACWHEGMQGEYQRQWRSWADQPEVYGALCRGEAPQPPPDRDDLAR